MTAKGEKIRLESSNKAVSTLTREIYTRSTIEIDNLDSIALFDEKRREVKKKSISSVIIRDKQHVYHFFCGFR